MASRVMTQALWEQFVTFASRKLTRVHGALLEDKAIGDEGEEIIAELLQQNGFLVSRSPGSRSPADVWGYRLLRYEKARVCNVVLIQVKSSSDGIPNIPKSEKSDLLEMRPDVVMMLRQFCKRNEILMPSICVVTPRGAAVDLNDYEVEVVRLRQLIARRRIVPEQAMKSIARMCRDAIRSGFL